MADLSEQRPSLIPGDRVAVTDPPNCTKRLGNYNIVLSLCFDISDYDV